LRGHDGAQYACDYHFEPSALSDQPQNQF
jgi:hypothetical protein